MSKGVPGIFNLSRSSSWNGSSASYDLNLVVVVGFCVVSLDLLANQFIQLISVRLVLGLVIGCTVVCVMDGDVDRSSSTHPNVAYSTLFTSSCFLASVKTFSIELFILSNASPFLVSSLFSPSCIMPDCILPEMDNCDNCGWSEFCFSCFPT